MSNRDFLNQILAKVLLRIIFDSICCMNCQYYYANINLGFCTIDKQDIPCELSHIYKCNAFSTWYGIVD